MQHRMLAGKEPHHPKGGDGLGDHRGQGGALGPHFQQEDKDGVQDNIGYRADDHGVHAGAGKALGADEGVKPQGQLHKGGAPGIDAHIGFRILDGVFTGAKHKEQGPTPNEDHRHQHNAE